uniref:Uncharacterized protein n=1 Tax=Sus scrofa TaxID=9823 RepID=A0A4X1TP18_PIG
MHPTSDALAALQTFLISLYNLVFASRKCFVWFGIYQLETVSPFDIETIAHFGGEGNEGISALFLLTFFSWQQQRQ